MSLKEARMLLLVVVTLGCGEKPAPPVKLGPVPEPESVAANPFVVEPEPVSEEAKQSLTGPEVGRDAAIAAIEKLGGMVVYDEAPETGRHSADMSPTMVSFAGHDVTDAALKHLKGLAELKSVGIAGTRVTDAGLVHLKGMTGLEDVNVADTQITDAGLEHLKGMTNLRTLFLLGTQVTDVGLEHLKGMTNLHTLYLQGTQVTDDGLEHLKGLTSLRELYLNSTQVTDAGVNELKKALPNVTVIR